MTSTPLGDHNSTSEESTSMSSNLTRVQKVIQRFKEIIIELSSLVSADVRTYKLEELQTISEQMCIVMNELIHMTKYSDEVFTADDFMLIARKMSKQHEVRKKILVITLRGYRALLETISKCINADSSYSEKACVAIEAAVSKMESVVPRASVYKPSMWDCCCGSN